MSTGRAIMIATYLMDKGIAPDRIMVSGRADTQPIFANDTPEHRQMNSRAEIVILYKSVADKVIDSSTLIDPNGQNTPTP
ncbi:MAG TPA: OmpA family protein [Leptolinea sp.]